MVCQYPEPEAISGQLSPNRLSKVGYIPPRAADCIAIFVKQFLQSLSGGKSLAAENISLPGAVNGVAAYP